MVSPFEKLLELGFKGSEKPKNVEPAPASPARPKAKKAKKIKAPPSTASAKHNNPKKHAKPAKRAAKAAPAFVMPSPNPQLLTANGFKKAPPYRPAQTKPAPTEAGKTATTAGRSSKKPKPKQKPKPAPLAIPKTVASLTSGLPDRTMSELQQQWLNLLTYMEKQPEHRHVWNQFHDALIAEWGRRHHFAHSDPDHFVWPSTAVGPGDKSQGFGNWHSEGILAYLGYRVGATNGATDFARRRILDAVFACVLPPINDPNYIRDWGKAGSAARLKRLANEIARFAQNGKRKRSADMSSAVADWEADLLYLYREYYVGKFGFGWPQIK